MSSRKVKKYRGPSRPVDPRYAPGQPTRKGPDLLGFWIIGGSAAFVIVLILFIAASQNNTAATTTTTDTGSSSSANPNPTSASVDTSALGTATAVAFATETAGLPRMSSADAKPLIEGNKVKVFDVRETDRFATEH